MMSKWSFLYTAVTHSLFISLSLYTAINNTDDAADDGSVKYGTAIVYPFSTLPNIIVLPAKARFDLAKYINNFTTVLLSTRQIYHIKKEKKIEYFD